MTILDFTNGQNNTEVNCPVCGRPMYCCEQLGDKIVTACNYEDCQISFIHIFPEPEEYVCEERPVFDRFDICEAYYLYATHYHEGQFSAIYKIFGRLRRMGIKLHQFFDINSLSDNGRLIYTNLIFKNHLRGK